MKKMVHTHCKLDSYTIPSKEILRNRLIFYELWRKSDDPTTAWLKRVQSYIGRCGYPTIIMEFLLFDRFVCGLNANESAAIQSVSKSWTLKQLLEHFLEESTDTGHNDANLTAKTNVHQIENISLEVVKTEPNDEECLQNVSFNECADVDDPFAELNFNRVEKELPADENATPNDTEETILEKPYPCDLCEKTYATPSSLSKHRLVIHRGKHGHGHTCHECGKWFSSDEKFKTHLAKHSDGKHSEEKTENRTYACDQCDKVYAIPSSLWKHKKFNHRTNRTYVCQKCGRWFSSDEPLKTHMITHNTNRRRYACDLCDKVYARPSSLSKHRRAIHRGMRSHLCHACGKWFTSAEQLKAHSVKHSEENTEKTYACNQCEKVYSQSSSLSKHKRTIHRGQRMCHECGKWFTSAEHLKAHSATHTIRKRYACKPCDKTFAQLSGLSKHKRCVHRGIANTHASASTSTHSST